jgi:hypothetical protein
MKRDVYSIAHCRRSRNEERTNTDLCELNASKLDSVVQLDFNVGGTSLGFLVLFCLCLIVWVMENFILVLVPLMVIFVF